MRRRDFIKVIAGSATVWPLAARAQQTALPVIGFLHLTSLETNRENLATFRQGLADTGYIFDRIAPVSPAQNVRFWHKADIGLATVA
jgi:putative ABC transport system substrate-binding protein